MSPKRKAYNEANKEKIKKSLKAYREKHKEEIAEYERRREQSPHRRAMKKIYAKRNYQKYILQKEEYRKSHIKERKEWWKRHYAEKKEYYKELSKKYFDAGHV